MNLNKINLEKIDKIYKDNFSIIHNDFMIYQSKFILEIYSRCKSDLDCGNIVLFFAQNLHRNILHHRDNDLDYDISFESFWEKNKNISQKNYSIIDVANATGLPRETARRKIQLLIKEKILLKQNTKVFWKPHESIKDNYLKVTDFHVSNLLNHIQVINNFLGLQLDNNFLKKEIFNNFSFYYYHYLKSHRNYLNIWQKKFQDLELFVIAQECIILANRQFLNNRTKLEEHFFLKKNLHFVENISISASTISEITKIPRATCIRKLKILLQLKIIKKDEISKKYSLSPKTYFNALGVKEILKETTKLSVDFYLVIINALIRSKKISLKE